MCGIVGYVGSKQAAPLLMEGLKRLEYRGYDSAGLSVITEGQIVRRRAQGKLSQLEALLKSQPVKGSVALGHTRWATHGKPSEENAHPHTDCKKEIVIIHNGIIENYMELKDALMQKGHIFESETDTETVVHLVEEKLKTLAGPGKAPTPDLNEPLLFEAVRQALNELRGAYALAVLWSKAPGVIVAAKTASPLVIGLGEGENFLASDVPAFMAHTRRAVFLEDGEMAVVRHSGATYFTLAGRKIEKSPVQIQWDRTMAEKGGFRHFMLKEIHEQPQSCEDTMRGRFFPLKDGLLREAGLSSAAMKGVRQVHIVACGTAFHAGLIGKYWIEGWAKVPTTVETASEFRYRDALVGPQDLVVAISQSGETADTLAAVRLAKERGAKVLSVCNSVGSAITRAADFNLYTHCGPELGVASTKAFIGQLTALAILTLHFSLARGSMDESQARVLIDEMIKLPGFIRQCLKLDAQVQEIAKAYHQKAHFLYIGRYVNYPIALEGALKLKEISYIHAEGYAAGELKHGPIALIDSEMPVVAIATRSKIIEKMISSFEEVRARGARLIILSTEGDKINAAPGDFHLKLPPVSELFSPIINVIPLQLLAYHIANLRGCDVDQPRNLAKSVTVE